MSDTTISNTTTIVGETSITGATSVVKPTPEKKDPVTGSIGEKKDPVPDVPKDSVSVTGGASIPSAVTTVKAPPAVQPTTAAITIPETVKPVVATPTPTQTVQQLNDTRQLSIIEELLAMYKTSLSDKVVSDAKFQEAAKSLSNVFTRIITNPTKSSLDLVWNFFVENETGILVPSVALSGIEVLPPAARQTTELGYVLFSKAVRGIDVSNPNMVNSKTVQTLFKAPRIIAYLSEKSKTVAK